MSQSVTYRTKREDSNNKEGKVKRYVTKRDKCGKSAIKIKGGKVVDVFDEIIIKNYLSLSSQIKRLILAKKQLRQEFYSQNMATHMEYHRVRKDTYEMIVKGFRPDREVEKLLTNIDALERRIDRYLFRQKHFIAFLATLTPSERSLLIGQYKYLETAICPQNLIEKVLDEINEIETAICFREGIEPDDENNEILEDVEENLERMCDFFAI